MIIKPKPVSPGAGIPALKEMKIIPAAIAAKSMRSRFFILICFRLKG